MKRVICFLRVSTTAQDLTAQREKVVAAIVADGYKKSEIVYVEGKESAIKNDEEHRLTLNQLKEEIERHPIEAVYCFAIDRLARKVSIVLSIKDYLMDRNINLTFLNPHRMSTLREDEKGNLVPDEFTALNLLFLGYGAEMEMKIKLARFTGAKDLMKRQGKLYTGKPLFGYSIDKDGFPVENEDADTVREICALLCDGMSCASVYKKLMGEGKLKPVKTYHAMVSFVRRIAFKAGYVGEGIYPPLLTKEAQERARKAITEGQKKPKTSHKHTYLCKGIIWWKDMGKMVGEKGSKKYRYDEKRGSDENKSHCINMEVADGIAWMFCRHHYVLSVAKGNKDRNNELKKRMKENEVKMEKYRGMMSDCEKRLDKAFNRYVLGDVPDATYEATVKQIKGLLSDYSKQLANLEVDNSVIQRTIGNVMSGIVLKDTFADLDALDIEKKVEIMQNVVSSIVVDKEGSVSSITLRSSLGETETYYYSQRGGRKDIWYIGRNGEKRMVKLS